MVKKKILVDYSWINKSLSGGALKSCQNLHNIFTNEYFNNYYDCTFLINKSQKNLFKFKNFKRQYAPKNIILNHLFRFFLFFFLKNINEIDIIFIPNIYSPIFNGKAKIYNLIHDGQWLIFPEYFSFTRKIWLRLNYYIINIKKNKCIFTTKYVKQQYTRLLFNSSSVVIPLPFIKSINQFKKIKIIENIKFNLILSSNLPHKNIEIIKKVQKKRKKKFKNIYLVIAGIGQTYNLDKKNKIFNLGEVSESEKNWLFNKCENFLIPSLYEGFGMIMIESMIYSKKVISSNIASLIETGNNSINYIKNPKSEKEWDKNIFYSKKKKVKKFNIRLYTQEIIKKYTNIFFVN